MVETIEEQIQRLQNEARSARQAIRHALQFLQDPTHKGDGHLDECIANCNLVLGYEPKTAQHAYGWHKPTK
jgi:hypothetical protein